MGDTETAGDEHEAIEAVFSDYYERALPEAKAKEVEQHLAECDVCRQSYEEFKETVGALSGLHKMSAPQRFEANGEDKIRRRSAGRFFGRKAFGDRVPFELLAIIALLIGLAVFYFIRSSGTGSLRYEKDPGEEKVAPGAREAMPQP